MAGAIKEEMSEMMVGRKVDFVVEKKEMKPLGTALSVRDMTIRSKRTGKMWWTMYPLR